MNDQQGAGMTMKTVDIEALRDLSASATAYADKLGKDGNVARARREPLERELSDARAKGDESRVSRLRAELDTVLWLVSPAYAETERAAYEQSVRAQAVYGRAVLPDDASQVARTVEQLMTTGERFVRAIAEVGRMVGVYRDRFRDARRDGTPETVPPLPCDRRALGELTIRLNDALGHLMNDVVSLGGIVDRHNATVAQNRTS
jgi:hypothetical protein